MPRVTEAIRIVVIESPYDSLPGNVSAQALLMRALMMKLGSYRDVYPYGVMPLDTYDYLSTHHLVGLDREGEFQPLMAYRTILSEKCDLHRLPFPALLALRDPTSALHARVLGELLRQWKERGERVSFGSSWGIDPALRADRELRDFLKELMTATLVHHETSLGTAHLLGAGMTGVHTDRYFREIGYEVVEHDGFPLPPFRHASLLGAEALLLHAGSFNARALEIAARYREYWERREVVSAPAPTEEKRAA
jgi:hypothetical protein